MYFADKFKAALNGGGRALFVGIGEEQLPPEYRDDPRLICWDSDSPYCTSLKIPVLPARVSVVVMTRFLRHATAQQINKLAKRVDAVVFNKLSGTGEIARMLKEAIPVQPRHVPVTLPVPAPPPQFSNLPLVTAPLPKSFKTVTDLVRYFAGPVVTERPVGDRKRVRKRPDAFYHELVAKAHTYGFPTDVKRIKGIIANLRTVVFATERGPVDPPTWTPPRSEAVPEADVLPTPLYDFPLTPAQSPPPVVTDALPANLEALVKMADELDFKAVVASELADHLRRLVAEQRELRAIKEKFVGIRTALEHSLLTTTTSLLTTTA